MLDNIREVYRYRTLVWALVTRHLSSRYRGSFFGFFWTLLNPLCLMAVYALVFTYYIRFNQVPHYTVFLFCGLLPWLWLTSALIEGTSSIVSSGHLITKSMFPAQILPTVAVITTLINFVLSLPVLAVFLAVSGLPFHPTLVALPLIILIQFVFIEGVVLALGALNVHFRDVQHIVANLLTFLFFLCPILYPVSSVPQPFRFTLDLNPLAVFTVLYHQVILEGVWPSPSLLLYVGLFAGITLLLGNMIFNRYRESFAELL